ncbi:MAG: hypothetical protein PHV06_10045 [bacterium]|nr:hypothetical protein [bacterium]
MKNSKKKRFLKGSSLIEVLVAIVIITIAFSAVVKMIIIGGRASRSAQHSSEALIIAQKWVEKSKAKTFEDSLVMDWIKENDQPEYSGRPNYLSWIYWVERDETYVVLEQTPDPIADTPYTVRAFRDSNPADGIDDFTGQEKDLKQVIVRVGWAEARALEDKNDLDTDNQTWIRNVFWKEVELKTLIAKPKPREDSCCLAPTVSEPIFVDVNTGNQIAQTLQTVEACTDVKVQVRVEDQCAIANLSVILYYIGSGTSDTKTVSMQSLGGMGYYEATIPGEDVKNYDGACEVTEPDGNPDLTVWVVATDSYIGGDCPAGTVRVFRSSNSQLDIRDTSVP